MSALPVKDSLSRDHLLKLHQEAEESATTRRQPLLTTLLHGGQSIAPMGPQGFSTDIDPQKIYRYIVGREEGKDLVEMPPSDAQKMLNDPFANLVLKKDNFPLSAQAIVNQFEQLPQTETLRTFVVAEGGQILWDSATEKANRSFRLTFAITTKGGIGPDVLISTPTNTDSERVFLQLMGWDPVTRSYNFYQRLKSIWVWSGNSFDALSSDTRNRGPFSGHRNGGPIMKELKQPWQHWSSMNGEILSSALPPHDPFRTSPFFLKKDSGEIFESLVKAGSHQWNSSRIDAIQQGKISQPEHFFRQILSTTNVNLTSTSDQSKTITPSSELALPYTFFASTDALAKMGISPFPLPPIKIRGDIYLKNLQEFDFALQSNGVKIPQDNHFAFFVPEPAMEDIDLLDKMITREIISKRLAACMLMVDFPNPIYSKKREALQAYIPDELVVGNQGADLTSKFIANITQSPKATDPTTPEGEFMSYWKLKEDHWVQEFEKMISDYFREVQDKCSTQEGYNSIVKLAESRRHIFKKTPLQEFPLSFAETNVPTTDFPLEMTSKGVVKRSQA